MATDSIELSVPLPRSLDTRIYLRLSTKAKSIVLFLATATQDELSTPVSLGSFVYALPNVSSAFFFFVRPGDETLLTQICLAET
jgi:hypothetical protein